MFSSKTKLFWLRQAKAAVNTAISTVTMMKVLPSAFNIHDWKGDWHTLVLIGTAIGSQEFSHNILPLLAKLYIVIVAWSQSDTADEPVGQPGTTSEIKQFTK